MKERYDVVVVGAGKPCGSRHSGRLVTTMTAVTTGCGTFLKITIASADAQCRCRAI